MPTKIDEVEFLTKLSGEGRWPTTMEELVEGWISYWVKWEDKHGPDIENEYDWASDCAWDLVQDHGKLALEFVLAVLAKRPDRHVIQVLAAGPLEDALAYHGSTIIEKVEEEAKRSPEFRDLLGGVWQNQMSEEIWQRVLNAAPDRW